MIAAKLHGTNAAGIPSEWPAEVREGVDALPDGFDLLFADVAAYEAYRNEHRAAYDAWRATPAPAPIPWAISNADLRRGLAERGINPEGITAYLKGPALEDGPAKWIAIADWEFANYFERSHPLIDQLAPSFGMTSEDVDNLFRSKKPYWLQ